VHGDDVLEAVALEGETVANIATDIDAGRILDIRVDPARHGT
jgi:hypothetical protein